MTDKRKAEVWDALMFWVREVVNDDQELVRVLRHKGFTDEEIADEFDMDISEFPPNDD